MWGIDWFSKKNYLHYIIFALCCFIFASGFINYSYYKKNSATFNQQLEKKEFVIWDIKDKVFYFEIIVKAKDDRHKYIIKDIKKDFKNLKEGEIIILSGKVKKASTIYPDRNKEKWNSFDYQNYLESKNILGYIYDYDLQLTQEKSYIFYLQETKNKIKEKLSLYYDLDQIGIIFAVLLGDDKYLREDIKDKFIQAGLGHSLVFSGFNFFVLLSLFWFGLFFLSKKFRVLLMVVLSFLILFIVNTEIPTLRAEAFLLLGTLVVYNNWPMNIKNFLWLFTFFYLLFNPTNFINDTSFHLTFLACFCIIYVSGLLNKTNLNIFYKTFILLTSVSLFLLPYIAYTFGQFQPLSFLSNIFSSLLIVIIMYLSLFSILFSLLFNHINIVFSFFNGFFINLLNILAEIFSHTNLDLAGSSPGALVFVWNIIFIIFYFAFSLYLKNRKINKYIDKTIK